MDTIYEKLLEELRTITPEQEAAEWDALKEFNQGPSFEEYEQLVERYKTVTVHYSSGNPHVHFRPKTDFYLAA